jgi:phosphotriesterase-related protein
MARSRRSGFVQTVLGLIEPGQLGITLTHEHLLLDLRLPDKRDDPGWPITLENSGRNRRHPNENPRNACLTSVQEALEELADFRRRGGGALVEATSIGLARDARGLKAIAEAARIHVVMGSSYYVQAYHPREVADRSEREIAAEIVRDLTEGVDETDVRAGIIGEVGLSWPHHRDEVKVLRASATAQRESGAPLLIHPGRHRDSPLEAMRIVKEAGGDPARTIMSHIDRTLFTDADMRALAETGCCLEFDLFGQESSFYTHAPIDMPNDAVRIDHLMRLIRQGFRDQLVIAHDICHKHGLVRYGGEGYGHILENVLPMMRRKGMREEDLDAILVRNPARLLAFA